MPHHFLADKFFNWLPAEVSPIISSFPNMGSNDFEWEGVLEAFFIFLHKGNLTFIPSIQPLSSNTYCVHNSEKNSLSGKRTQARWFSCVNAAAVFICASLFIKYWRGVQADRMHSQGCVHWQFFLGFFLRRGLGEPAGRDRAVTSAFRRRGGWKIATITVATATPTINAWRRLELWFASVQNRNLGWNDECKAGKDGVGCGCDPFDDGWMDERAVIWKDGFHSRWMMDGSLVDGCNMKWMHAVMNEWKTEWMHGRTPDWWKLQREWMKWWWPTERVNGMNNERGNHRRHPRGFRRFCRSSF